MRANYPHLLTKTLLGLLFLGSAFRTTDDFQRELMDRLQAYMQLRPTEKVYVHTDRDVYLAGETLWLKGYLLNGITHDIDTFSRVVYIDLIDQTTHQLRLHAQLQATLGYAPGQLALPDSLSAGAYQLRGYTNFMRNELESYFSRSQSPYCHRMNVQIRGSRVVIP